MSPDSPESNERPKRSNLAVAIGKNFAVTIAAGAYGVTQAPTNESAAAIVGVGFCVDAFRYVAGKLKSKGESTKGPTNSSWSPDTAEDIRNLPSVQKARNLSGTSTDPGPSTRSFNSGDFRYDHGKGDRWSKANAKRQMNVTKR